MSEIILTDAADLFLRLGYDAVDMKQVAAEAGTSVGNLYNYFPSKPALFLAIRDRWKKELVETCRDVLASDRPRRERILAVLGRFYDDVSKWHGIWHEFMAGQDNVPNGSEFRPKRGGIPHWEMSPEEQELTAKLDSLLLDRPAAAPPYRSAFLCITATLQLAVRYPQYREDNWKFIETLVDKL